MILILADRTDSWADLVHHELLHRGAKVVFMENAQILSSLGLNWRVDSYSSKDKDYFTIDSQKILFTDLTGVLARIRYPIRSPFSGELNKADQEYVGKEAHATFLGLLNALPCPVVNRPIPGAQSRCLFTDQPQRNLAKHYGFLLPEGMVTSCQEEARNCLDRWGQGVRALVMGAEHHEHIFHDRDEAAHLLNLMGQQVVSLQGIPRGQFISVYTIGDSAIGAFWGPGQHSPLESQPTLHRIDLSSELKERCCRLAHALHLEFSELILLQGEDGETYCFEVNGAPLFDRCEEAVQKKIIMSLGTYLEQGMRSTPDDFIVRDHNRPYFGQRLRTPVGQRL